MATVDVYCRTILGTILLRSVSMLNTRLNLNNGALVMTGNTLAILFCDVIT